MQINKRQLKKWIAALDSGEYKQGHGKLQSTFGFCCLGVACKVLIPLDKQARYSNGQLYGGYHESQRSAPEWLKNINNDFANKTGERLSVFNDCRDFTFPEIATLLELVYIHKILD